MKLPNEAIAVRNEIYSNYEMDNEEADRESFDYGFSMAYKIFSEERKQKDELLDKAFETIKRLNEILKTSNQKSKLNKLIEPGFTVYENKRGF